MVSPEPGIDSAPASLHYFQQCSSDTLAKERTPQPSLPQASDLLAVLADSLLSSRSLNTKSSTMAGVILPSLSPLNAGSPLAACLRTHSHSGSYQPSANLANVMLSVRMPLVCIRRIAHCNALGFSRSPVDRHTERPSSVRIRQW